MMRTVTQLDESKVNRAQHTAIPFFFSSTSSVMGAEISLQITHADEDIEHTIFNFVKS